MERRHPLEGARAGDICVKYKSKVEVPDFIAVASKHI